MLSGKIFHHSIPIQNRIKYLSVKYQDNHVLATSSLSLTIGGQPLTLEIPLPTEKVTAETMLPLFQEVTNLLVDISVKEAEKENRQISCQKGCGKCCSQLVPITKLEASYLKKVIDTMPESQRTVVLEKFKVATQQLSAANMLEKLKRLHNRNKEQRIQLGLEYFKLDIPCPFLEDNSCSIHLQRPMACREYLVTSPVKNCATPGQGLIDGVIIPSKVSNAVGKISPLGKKGQLPWMPLTLLSDYKPVKQPEFTGLEWLQKLFRQLT